mmetsp:Transcript_34313/g.73280  ORF Transcript_34313/g.73280 Transcript_34313/m.73280 type:complete len:227 (+) Transcript_34313:196-876(+)
MLETGAAAVAFLALLTDGACRRRAAKLVALAALFWLRPHLRLFLYRFTKIANPESHAATLRSAQVRDCRPLQGALRRRLPDGSAVRHQLSRRAAVRSSAGGRSTAACELLWLVGCLLLRRWDPVRNGRHSGNGAWPDRRAHPPQRALQQHDGHFRVAATDIRQHVQRTCAADDRAREQRLACGGNEARMVGVCCNSIGTFRIPDLGEPARGVLDGALHFLSHPARR